MNARENEDRQNMKTWHRQPDQWNRPAFRKALKRLTGDTLWMHPNVAQDTIKRLQDLPERFSNNEYRLALLVATGVWISGNN